MVPAVREELVNKVRALGIRREADGAVAGGESPTQVYGDCVGVTAGLSLVEELLISPD